MMSLTISAFGDVTMTGALTAHPLRSLSLAFRELGATHSVELPQPAGPAARHHAKCNAVRSIFQRNSRRHYSKNKLSVLGF